ncbi:MAG: hypothetical protein IPP47_21245 [Bryobacterales bacterium]|nr:hypothetical protein [Bryobacterales bacterium]
MVRRSCRRAPRIRSCGLKDAKDKLCAGTEALVLFGDELKERFGADAELYRCEKCKAVYLPNEEEESRSGTLSY